MSQSGEQNGSDPASAVGPVQSRRLGATAEISGPQGPAAAAETGSLGGADAAGAASAVQGASDAPAVSANQAVAQALQAGAIDAEAARAALIEQAIAAHLPAGTDAAVVAAVRAELQAALADDPTLNALLR